MKIRLIPVLFFKNGNLVRSENFSLHQILGDPFLQVKRYNSWNVDEIIYLDISSEKKFQIKDKSFSKITSFEDVMNDVSKTCFSPLVFGGGILTIEDAKNYFQNGADKISLNTLILEDFNKISEFANIFGSQSIVASIDIIKDKGKYKIYSAKKNKIYDFNFIEFIKDVEKKGAGEILLNSVDRDGTAEGYDTKLIKYVNDRISIPLIPCGGAGEPKHFMDLLQITKLSAIAAGNIFNFKERSYEKIKKYLKQNNFRIR